MQDLDRPHYYSQFWIDVASGKRDLAASHSVEAEIEPEFEDIVLAQEPVELPKPVARPKPVRSEKKPEPVRPTITSLADLANIDLLMKNSAQMEGDEVPDLEAGAIGDLGAFTGDTTDQEPGVVTDFDLEEVTEEPEALSAGEHEDEFGEIGFDEEEEEDEWGGPRKSSKPSKQQRRRERDRGRGF